MRGSSNNNLLYSKQKVRLSKKDKKKLVNPNVGNKAKELSPLQQEREHCLVLLIDYCLRMKKGLSTPSIAIQLVNSSIDDHCRQHFSKKHSASTRSKFKKKLKEDLLQEVKGKGFQASNNDYYQIDDLICACQELRQKLK